MKSPKTLMSICPTNFVLGLPRSPWTCLAPVRKAPPLVCYKRFRQIFTKKEL